MSINVDENYKASEETWVPFDATDEERAQILKEHAERTVEERLLAIERKMDWYATMIGETYTMVKTFHDTLLSMRKNPMVRMMAKQQGIELPE